MGVSSSSIFCMMLAAGKKRFIADVKTWLPVGKMHAREQDGQKEIGRDDGNLTRRK
jgi:hypothetical protein